MKWNGAAVTTTADGRKQSSVFLDFPSLNFNRLLVLNSNCYYYLASEVNKSFHPLLDCLFL